MWYGVETVFVDGKLFDSYCVGKSYNNHDEEPMNKTKKECNGRIEIHLDWFETVELAEAFRDGKITYIHHYDSYYKRSINSTLSRFTKREIVQVDIHKGYFPHRGLYVRHEIEGYCPYWAR